MPPRKTKKPRTQLVGHGPSYFNKQKRRSLAPTQFDHDLIIQLFFHDLIMNRICDEAVEEVQQTKQALNNVAVFLNKEAQCYDHFLTDRPEFLLYQFPRQNKPDQPQYMPRHKLSKQALLEGVNRIKHKDKALMQSQSMYEGEVKYRPSLAASECLDTLDPLYIINKVKKEYLNQSKNKQYAPINLRDANFWSPPLQPSLKQIRLFKQTNSSKEKAEKNRYKNTRKQLLTVDEYVLDSNAEPLKLKKKGSTRPMRKNNSMIIQAQKLEKSDIKSPKMDLIKPILLNPIKVNENENEHIDEQFFHRISPSSNILEQILDANLQKMSLKNKKGVSVKKYQRKRAEMKNLWQPIPKLPRIKN